jgi:hypothetical protein
MFESMFEPKIDLFTEAWAIILDAVIQSFNVQLEPIALHLDLLQFSIHCINMLDVRSTL